MKTTIAGLSLIAAALFGMVAAAPAPAMAADNTVNLTLNCTGPCTGSWDWYQSGTLLASGSITGANDTTRDTTVQPATADSVIIFLHTGSSAKGCGASQGDSFSPGSHINVTVKLREQPNAYHDGCYATFSIKS